MTPSPVTPTGGNTEATGIASGDFSAQAHDGRLKVVFTKPPQQVDASVVGGNVNVTCRPGASGTAPVSPRTTTGRTPR
ncbi:hypothetical protein [Streptomyces sp. NPDC014733]|uniref:hypothetical protein n=1 Tax=Streptomyces sp. NPDC014733 TaxID=3364885 RepID=UPI003702463E